MKTRAVAALSLLFLLAACIPITITIGQPQTAPSPAPFIPSLPDLVITSSLISMVDINGNCLESYELTAVILNQGNAPAENVVVEELMSGHLIYVGTLQAQQSMVLQFPASPTGRYRVMIDPQSQIAESDESNNIHAPSAMMATPPGYCLPGMIRTQTATAIP